MKKNLYYETFHKRSNGVNTVFSILMDLFSSIGKSLLEVFIRKNMGERYFSPLLAVFFLAIVSIAPFAFGFSRSFSPSFFGTISENISWYSFVLAYGFFCFKRYQEQRRETSLFDFTRFSYSSGDMLPIFEKINISGKPANPRQIATLLEPAFFFIIGLVLLLFKQEIGLVILVSSVLYWYNRRTSFVAGDHFILDIIDDKICSDYFIEDFANGSNSSKGFSPTFRWPTDPNLRREIVDGIFEDGGFAPAL